MDEAEQAVQPPDYQPSVSWTASEFIAHAKAPGWYAILAGSTAVAVLIIYVLTRDFISAAVVAIGAIFFGIYAGRQPRQLAYRVDEQGLQIGQKFYGYEQFRSFSVVPEGAFSSIVLMPLKRFAPVTTIYYAPEDEEHITNILANELPFAEHRHDAIDRLMRHIRF